MISNDDCGPFSTTPRSRGASRPVGMLAVAAACGLLPCQLTLDVGQRPARASAGRLPAADAPLSPGIQRAVEIPAGFGCAS